MTRDCGLNPLRNCDIGCGETREPEMLLAWFWGVRRGRTRRNWKLMNSDSNRWLLIPLSYSVEKVPSVRVKRWQKLGFLHILRRLRSRSLGSPQKQERNVRWYEIWQLWRPSFHHFYQWELEDSVLWPLKTMTMSRYMYISQNINSIRFWRRTHLCLMN